MKEYIKLYWAHTSPKEKDEPVVILYEVDLSEERYATRLVDIYADRSAVNIEDKEFGFVTECPVPAVDEFNSDEYGAEFKTCIITGEEFERTWESGIYQGALFFDQ